MNTKKLGVAVCEYVFLFVLVALFMIGCEKNNTLKNKNMKRPGIVDILPHYPKEIKVFEPKAIVTIFPNYPREALDKKIEGDVTIEFTLTKEGIVKNPIIINSSTSIFEKNAIKAILKYKFSRRLVGYEVKEAKVIYLIAFRLAKE